MPQWDTVAIVGIGLIGGSIGLALCERKLARRIIGIGRRPESLERAKALGCAAEVTTDLRRGVQQADVVIVSTPVDSVAGHVLEAAGHCSDWCLITDAGSTKRQIVAEVEAALVDCAPRRMPFVGSHPIAGSEKTGPEAARADLFVDRVVVVTQTSRTDQQALNAIANLWTSLGARVLTMSPEEHDAALARSSHLPHAIAAVLAAATPLELLELTGTGWQDTTRIAAGDAELWRQILLSNREPTLKALADFETVLSRLRSALQSADGSQLVELLAEGKRRRDAVGN